MWTFSARYIPALTRLLTVLRWQPSRGAASAIVTLSTAPPASLASRCSPTRACYTANILRPRGPLCGPLGRQSPPLCVYVTHGSNAILLEVPAISRRGDLHVWPPPVADHRDGYIRESHKQVQPKQYDDAPSTAPFSFDTPSASPLPRASAPDFLRLEHLAASCQVCPLFLLRLIHSYIGAHPSRRARRESSHGHASNDEQQS